MTDEQRTGFYIPKWLEISAKLDWRTAGGRLVADLDEQFRAVLKWPDHAGGVARLIITNARMAAMNKQRAVKADDLRHACNEVASGRRTDSSRKFAQRDFNHFDRLRAVLCNPWDLTATIAWLDPAEDDRKRTLVYLRKLANEGRLIAIARNTWGVSDVDSLSQARLDALTAEVKGKAWPRYPKKQAARLPF